MLWIVGSTMVKLSSSAIVCAPLSTDIVFSIGGRRTDSEAKVSALLLIGSTMVRSSSLMKLVSSGMDDLLSLLDGRDLGSALGEATRTGLGEERCRAGLATGLLLSSRVLTEAEIAADLVALATVS